MKCLFEMHVKLYNEMKIFHIVGTTSKYNSKIVEKGKIDTLNTQIRDHSLSWLGTCTSKNMAV